MKLVHVHPGRRGTRPRLSPDARHPSGADRVLLGARRTAAAERDRLARRGGHGAHADYLAWSEKADAAAGRRQSRRDHGVAARAICRPTPSSPTAPAISPAGSIASTASANTPPMSAPTSGSMGYGFPAAVGDEAAASGAHGGVHRRRRRFPDDRPGFRDRRAVRAAGHRRARDNGLYGTIRMHQEREYPGRVVATRTAQSGFRRLCQGVRRLSACVVEKTADFPAAFAPGGAIRQAVDHPPQDRSGSDSRHSASISAIREKALAGGGRLGHAIADRGNG